MPLFSSPPKELCLLRLSAIGDCVHAVALVQAIQRQWPETRITWIMGKVEAGLLGDLPGIEVIPFDKKQGWRAYLQVWRRLRGRRFDALLHMQSALRASLLSLGIRARYRLGFDKERAGDGQSWFTNHKVTSPASPHVLDGFMAFAQELGVQELTPSWHIPTSSADDEWASQHLDKHSPTLLIAPAASKAFKNWTAAGYAALADHAAERGYQVLLCGGPSTLEKNLAQEILSRCQHKPGNLIGQTSLKQLMALIKQAQLVLAPDTGPTHMATAAGVPVIGLYAHHNPERTGPYHCRDYVVSVYAPMIEAKLGKPVAQLPWRSRLKDDNAMQQITPERVIAQFDRIDRTRISPQESS
ncbi:MAG: glycosyltransferase family 9 protein [Aeromonadaceae bacterium]